MMMLTSHVDIRAVHDREWEEQEEGLAYDDLGILGDIFFAADEEDSNVDSSQYEISSLTFLGL